MHNDYGHDNCHFYYCFLIYFDIVLFLTHYVRLFWNDLQLVGDISIDEPNEDSIYLDANAQDEIIDQYDDDDDDEELLTSNFNDPATSIMAPVEKLSLNNYVHNDDLIDDDDMDDDELLTSGINEPSPRMVGSESVAKKQMFGFDDDDDDDDENLLAD